MSDTPATGIALLVVDVQPTFLKAMPEGEACLRRCVLAASAAKLLGVPVLFTEQVPAKLGPTHPDLLLAAGEGRAVFGKTAFSAFGAPGLVEDLRQPSPKLGTGPAIGIAGRRLGFAESSRHHVGHLLRDRHTHACSLPLCDPGTLRPPGWIDLDVEMPSHMPITWPAIAAIAGATRLSSP